MGDPTPRMQELFFAVFEGLPRQGPGDRRSAQRALALCEGLPAMPRILDLGCGGGGQTFHLLELTGGSVVAVDNHAPSIRRLRTTVVEHGVQSRVEPMVGDIASPGLAAESFDLIWSEGALYNVGIPVALDVCRGLLRPGGCLAFTEAVWRRQERPEAVRAAFADHPAMGFAADVVSLVAASDFTMLGHFTLPDAAWWDDFYTPMEARIEQLRGEHAHDSEALAILDAIAGEPAMHRRHADCYGYEFFVLRL